jgi:hypothetical protein
LFLRQSLTTKPRLNLGSSFLCLLSAGIIGVDHPTQLAKVILRTNRAGDIALPDFKVCYKAIVIQTEKRVLLA